MNNKGQTTVLFSLMISILFLFTLTALEVGRIYMSTVKINPCVHSMRSSIMADYNEELFERYHLLFMDPTYGTGSEAVVEEKITDYLEYSLNGDKGSPIYQFALEQIALAEKENILSEDMKLLKQQIADYEKTAGLISRVQEFAKELQGKESDISKAAQETVTNGTELNIPSSSEQENVDDVDKSLSSDDGEEKSATDQNGEKEKVKVDDPRDVLQKSLKLGVLAFVLPNGEISKEKYKMQDVPSKNYKEVKAQERNNQFKDIGFLNSFLQESAEEETVNGLLEHAAFASYVTSHFSNGLEKIKDSVMQCEVEYILEGKDNDYDNLEAVVNEMIWLRMPVNYAYLLTDIEKKSEALTLASAICVATGTEPLIEVVKYLLLGCWAYGESLYEMRLLLDGEDIAYVKNKTNWCTDLKTLTAVENAEKVTNGISYKEYLMVLLAKKSGSSLDTGYARILDVMSLNLQKNNPTLRISDFVGGMTIQGKISINSMFQTSKDATVYDYYFEEGFAYE